MSMAWRRGRRPIPTPTGRALDRRPNTGMPQGCPGCRESRHAPRRVLGPTRGGRARSIPASLLYEAQTLKLLKLLQPSHGLLVLATVVALVFGCAGSSAAQVATAT